jgi:pseudoazurin
MKNFLSGTIGVSTLIAILGLVFLSSLPAVAGTISIDMLNKRADGEKMVYSQDVVNVKIGDTVTWLPKSKGHNVQFISVPDGIKKLKKSKLNKQFSFTFERAGIYLYQCTPHKSMGMIGVVVVDGNVENKKIVAKTKVFGKSKKKLKKILSTL